MTDSIDTRTNWLDTETLNAVRGQVPIVYVDAVPVRVNDMGEVTHVGMLLRQAPDGSISRTVVSGRVLLGERIREALLRHLEKDLGSLALPRIPRAGPVHRRRILPRPFDHGIPRPAPSCGESRLRRSRLGRLPPDAAGARPRMVHSGAGDE